MKLIDELTSKQEDDIIESGMEEIRANRGSICEIPDCLNPIEEGCWLDDLQVCSECYEKAQED